MKLFFVVSISLFSAFNQVKAEAETKQSSSLGIAHNDSTDTKQSSSI